MQSKTSQNVIISSFILDKHTAAQPLKDIARGLSMKNISEATMARGHWDYKY